MEAKVALPAKGRSVVYFVGIGGNVKIGVSRNFRDRLSAFLTSAPDVTVLLTIDGDRDLEQRLHGLFAEARITRELFRRDWRITNFIEHVEYGGLERGLKFLEQTTPGKRAEQKQQEHKARVLERRKTKAEMDAYCASLVAERRQRLGW